MQNPALCFSPNRARIVAKVIDGEAIILDITRGAYYSMDGAGAFIWTGFEQGRSLGGILELLEAQYEADRNELETELGRLTEQLLGEGLVVTSQSSVTSPPPPAVPATRQAFVSPTLHKYTDMGDLLALDPPMPMIDDSADT